VPNDDDDAFRQQFIMETPQRKIIEKNEYSMLYDEEFLLLIDSTH
jgi:hypothetical protein